MPPRREIDHYTAAQARSLSTAKSAVRNDFNGDGRSDLLWHLYSCRTTNPNNTTIALWHMNGASISSTSVFRYSYPCNDPIYVYPGDFDGDGRGDVLVGQPGGPQPQSLWKGRDDGKFDTATVSPSMPNWPYARLQNNADLNGDGRDDVLLHNKSMGKGAYVLMDGPTILATTTFDLAAEYEITGAGDFDGDGLDDLLCSHTGLGYLYLWHNRGDGGFDVSLVSVYDPAWKIQGNPDLNGDGRADIVWDHESSGLVAFWWMDADAVLRADTRWTGHISGGIQAGDFDGDGIGDIAWTQPAYALLWRGHGDGDFDGHLLGAVGTSQWRLLTLPQI